jgi:1A family penicillin-binding protein
MKLLKFSVKCGLIAVLFFIIGYGGIYLYAKMTAKLPIDRANSFYLYDINNNLYSNSSNKEWISLDEISPHLINATIAVEDKNFYKHQGFDFLRIIKSLYVNFTTGKTLQGASTISQQYAKNLFLDFDKKWGRKIEEAWLTIRLESHYSKDQILEGYLNTINYGGIFGIENAAKYYFNKSAEDLDLAEASILAGIPKSPSFYSPLSNEEAAKGRQQLILKAMLKNEYISEEEMDMAYNQELTYFGTKEKSNLSTLMYYQDAVMDELKKIKTIPSSFLKTGGLKIYTNLDMRVQSIMDESIKNNIDQNNDLEVASVVMDPDTGKILALAGGRDYSLTQFNRAISSQRQVGSTMKPFLYYAALENGFTASTTFTSEKTTFTFSENKTYSPKNFGDKYGNKPISMAAALSYSDNIYAVKTHLFLGEDTLVDIAKRIGIDSKLEAIPSLALGSKEINIIEMMQGYAAFANEGYKVKPFFITKVEDINGNVLYSYNPTKENVLNKSIVFVLNEMLNNCYATEMVDYNYPTCISLAPQITNKYAIKTGTTDTDHLIFGYNKELVVGVWTGYDNNRKIETADGVANKQIWVDIMEGYFEDHKPEWYSIPKNVVGVLIDPISGKPATDNSTKKKIFYYIKGTEPYIQDQDLDDLIPTMKEEN